MHRFVTFVFRYVFLVVGYGFVLIGIIGAPGRGEPPLASLLHSTEARVVTSEVVEESRSGGRIRHWPRIEVAWPDATSGLAAEVRALGPSSRPEAEAVVAENRPGTMMRVRVAEGRPWADRTDRFALVWTIGAVLLGGLVGTVGLVINRALR